MQEVTHSDGKVIRSLFAGKNEVDLRTKLQDAYNKAMDDPTVIAIRQMKLDNKVVLYPNPILRKKCEEVKSFDSVLKAIVEEMFLILRRYRAAGLAAPQIGMSKRFFVCNVTGKKEDDLVFVNPVVLEMRGREFLNEQCLSLPCVEVNCGRAKKCHIEASDAEGHRFSKEAEGLLARVCLHEFEHLEGITILQYMNGTDKIINKKALKQLERFSKHGTS